MAASSLSISRGPRRWLGTLALSLLGADVGVRVAGRLTVTIGPAVARLRLVPASWPGTLVRLPPFGTARLSTHVGSTRLDVTLVGLDEQRARRLAADLDLDALGGEARQAATAAGWTLAIRTLVGGIGGAALVVGAVTRRVPDAAAGVLVGAGMLGAQGLLAAKTLRKDAWRHPTYTGLLMHVPALVGAGQAIPKDLGRYRAQLAEIVASVSGVLKGVSGLPGGPPSDAIRVVQVSDIHNNPLAFDAVRALVLQYAADAVLDTGDLTDWGSTAEAKAFAPIADLGVPYVFIKGNHDSAQTAAVVAKFANVTVLDGPDPHDVAGLRVVGVADPRFTPDKSSGGDEMTGPEIRALGAKYAADLQAGAADVAMVHSPAMAEALAGVVPLILSGHTHERVERRAGGSLFLVEGSSGGAGLRGVRQDPPHPLELSVLHLDRTTRRLHTIDQVCVGGLGRTEVTLVRRHVAAVAPTEVEPERPTW